MEKLSMDEYGAVVWAAYGVAILLLAGITWVSLRGLKKAKRHLKSIE